MILFKSVFITVALIVGFLFVALAAQYIGNHGLWNHVFGVLAIACLFTVVYRIVRYNAKLRK